jgi:hypothetical protein
VEELKRTMKKLSAHRELNPESTEEEPFKYDFIVEQEW